MKIESTPLTGVTLITPTVHGDARGFFLETWHAKRYREAGIALPFVQDNHSRSQHGVLRGLHLQKSRPQGKLVNCSVGSVFDVAVDVDPRSSSFGVYVGVELSGKNHRQLWIPPGYAHGFCVLSETADFHYKCTDLYFPNDEGGLIWNDPEVGIEWPIEAPSLSEKDLKLSTLDQIRRGLI